MFTSVAVEVKYFLLENVGKIFDKFGRKLIISDNATTRAVIFSEHMRLLNLPSTKVRMFFDRWAKNEEFAFECDICQLVYSSFVCDAHVVECQKAQEDEEEEEQARWEQRRDKIIASLPEYAKGKYACLEPMAEHGGQHEQYYVVDGCAECNGLTKGLYEYYLFRQRAELLAEDPEDPEALVELDFMCCAGSNLKYDEYYDCCMSKNHPEFNQNVFSDWEVNYYGEKTWDGFLELPDVRFVYAFWEKLGRVVEELSKKQAKSGPVYRWHVVQSRTRAIKEELMSVVWQYGSSMMRYEMGDRFETYT